MDSSRGLSQPSCFACGLGLIGRVEEQGCIKLQEPRNVGIAEISKPAGATADSTASGLEIRDTAEWNSALLPELDAALLEERDT
jgi:hypothetical protein